MKALFYSNKLAWIFTLLTGMNVSLASAQTLVIGDQYDVANSGSGFALGSGANSGINPPTTRLTGAQAANLRYIQSVGTRNGSLFYITNSDKMAIGPGTQASTLTLSTGSGSYDFGPALNTTAEPPATPGVYDLTINIANATAAANNYRCSFAFSSAAGNSGAWDFRTNLSYMVCPDSLPTRPEAILTGDSALSTDYPKNVTLAMPDNPAGGSMFSFNRSLIIRRGWMNSMRHNGIGILAFCDGSVSSTKSLQLQERISNMMDKYLPGANTTVRFMLPQYNSIPF